MRSLFLSMAPLFYFLLTAHASKEPLPTTTSRHNNQSNELPTTTSRHNNQSNELPTTTSRHNNQSNELPTTILRHNNQSSELASAIADMRRESYNGFVILLHLLNDTNLFKSQEITFLMPSDVDISKAEISHENLETFILRHTIPAWLMINHMLRFPNKTLVPCSLPDKMFTITKSGGSGLFVNNARIVSPNICENTRVSCHGISDVITFTQSSVTKGMISPKMLSRVRGGITSSRH